MKSLLVRNSILALGAVVGWLAVLLQLVLIIQNRVTGLTETFIRYFSFFTILTNILVAACFSLLWLNRKNFNPPSVLSAPRQTAVAVYILVVGIIYNAILRFLWSPTGLQQIVDEVLHLVVPLLYFTYWLLFVNKQSLRWKHAFTWLIYPFVYLVFILIRGRLATPAYYPYPFVDVSKLGYEKVFVNSLGLLLLFLLLSFIFVALGRLRTSKKQELTL